MARNLPSESVSNGGHKAITQTHPSESLTEAVRRAGEGKPPAARAPFTAPAAGRTAPLPFLCAAARCGSGCCCRAFWFAAARQSPSAAKPLALLTIEALTPCRCFLRGYGARPRGYAGARLPHWPLRCLASCWRRALRPAPCSVGGAAPVASAVSRALSARRLAPLPPPRPRGAPPFPPSGLPRRGAGAAPPSGRFKRGQGGALSGPASLRSQSLRAVRAPCLAACSAASPLRCAASGPCRAVCAPASPRAPVGWWRRYAPWPLPLRGR